MRVFDVADALRACLDAAYDTAVDEDKPASICHRPGAEAPFSLGTAEDECCAGLGWVRIAEIAPVLEPGVTEQPDFNPCEHPQRRITIELGVARCDPWGTPGAGPDCATWTTLADRMDLDALRMREAVCCLAGMDWVGEYHPVRLVLPGAWTPIESGGGCAGGSMLVYAYLSCKEC